MKKNIFFYVHKGNVKNNSIYLRGNVIYDEIKKSYPNCYLFDGTNINQIKNSIIVIIKYCWKRSLDIFKKNNNIIVYDIIDAFMHYRHEKMKSYNISNIINHADIIIYHNYELKKMIQKYFKNKKDNMFFQIHHQWDNRIKNNLNKDTSKCNICYLGDYSFRGKKYEHTTIDLSKFKDIDIIGSIPSKIEDNNYNVHVNLRKERISIVKPGTKISTASALNCNIITINEPSALELLGPDYPYLVSSLDENEIKKTIRYVKKTFKTDIWYKALETMKKVKKETSLESIIIKYKELFDNLINDTNNCNKTKN